MFLNATNNFSVVNNFSHADWKKNIMACETRLQAVSKHDKPKQSLISQKGKF